MPDSQANSGFPEGTAQPAVRVTPQLAVFLAALALLLTACTHQPDLAHGKQLFEDACAKCHQPRKDGIQVGPNLAKIKERSAEAIIDVILNPSKRIDPKYVNYIVRTKDGNVEDGLLVKDDATGVVLRDNEGDRLIPRAQVANIRASQVSLMPEDLEKGLSPESIRDLAAYVQSLHE